MLIKPMPGLETKFQLEPAGKLTRVIGPAVVKSPERARPTTFGGEIRLTGYDIRPSMISPGEQITVTLYWQPLNRLSEDYTTFVHILDAEGNRVAQHDNPPGGAYYPTSLWRPGELLKDMHIIDLPSDLGSSPFSIVVGLYALQPELHHLGRPEQVGVVAQQRPPDQLPGELVQPLNLTLDDQLALIGYEMKVGGNRLVLRLYWQALVIPRLDYTFFVHVVDGDDRIVAQMDQQPMGGGLPTRSWPRGYAVADEVTIELPPDLPAGQYRLVAGAYDLVTMQALPVYDTHRRLTGSRALLTEFTWPPAE
jgi:hypothetical protein